MKPIERPRTNNPFNVPIYSGHCYQPLLTKLYQDSGEAYLDVFVSFLSSERTTVTEQVYKAHSDTSIDIEDERVLLGGRHFLDGQCIVEQAVAREVLPHILLDELYTQIRVIDTLDLVADTRDCQIRKKRNGD